jgi:hypothetical protein
VWIGDYNGDQPNAIEYDLSGNPTGNAVPYSPVFAVDGGTDGKIGFQLGNAFSSTATVYGGGIDFSGSAPMLNVNGNDLVGITFDTVNGSIRVSIRRTPTSTRAGGSGDRAVPPPERGGCIAYEGSTDTIWYVGTARHDRPVLQGGRAASVLMSGLASNNWGGVLRGPAPASGVAARAS